MKRRKCDLECLTVVWALTGFDPVFTDAITPALPISHCIIAVQDVCAAQGQHPEVQDIAKRHSFSNVCRTLRRAHRNNGGVICHAGRNGTWVPVLSDILDGFALSWSSF